MSFRKTRSRSRGRVTSRYGVRGRRRGKRVHKYGVSRGGIRL